MLNTLQLFIIITINVIHYTMYACWTFACFVTDVKSNTNISEKIYSLYISTKIQNIDKLLPAGMDATTQAN